MCATRYSSRNAPLTAITNLSSTPGIRGRRRLRAAEPADLAGADVDTVTTWFSAAAALTKVQCIDTDASIALRYERDASAAPVLRRGRRRGQLHARGRPLRGRAAHAEPGTTDAGGRARRAAVRPRRHRDA